MCGQDGAMVTHSRANCGRLTAMGASEWISTPAGRLRRPVSWDVPTASGTLVIWEGDRILVCMTRPAVDPDNVDRDDVDRELEVVAAFGLPRSAVRGHLA